MQESTFEDWLWAQIRKDFGDHLMRQNELKKARENFEESLQFQPDKLDSVYRLARSQAREAKVEEALRNLKSRSRLDNYENHFQCNLQECDCFYELNEFEENILKLNARKEMCWNKPVRAPHCGQLTLKKLENSKPLGAKLLVLNKKFNTTITNFDDTIGKNAGECLWNQRKNFPNILKYWKPVIEDEYDAPLDVEEVDSCFRLLNAINDQDSSNKKSVKERFRIEQVKIKFAQSYMQSAWKDFVYINELKDNEILKASTQNVFSFEGINQTIDDCVESTTAFIEQLHARCPLYTKDHQMYRSEKHRKRVCALRSYRNSHRLCRAVFTAMREMIRWREESKLENLIKVAEFELGERFRVHSNKLIPRKNEFTIKICNYIALAHLDKLLNQPLLEDSAAKILDSSAEENYKRLGVLFSVQTRNQNVVVSYIFGDQSTYRDPAETETLSTFNTFKENIGRLGDRLRQKPMLPIEKCHILYEMGRANLNQQLIEETRNYGRRVVEMSDNVSHLWSFLGYIMVVRAEILQKNFKRIHDSLVEASQKLDVLNIEKLRMVMNEAIEIITRLKTKKSV